MLNDNCMFCFLFTDFLMTINHKHYIEIMTIKKAKKRAEIKVKKLQELIDEIRVRLNKTPPV